MRTTIDNRQFPGTCSPAPGTGNTLPAATLASGRGPTFLMRKLRLRELGYLVRTANKGKGRSGCVLNDSAIQLPGTSLQYRYRAGKRHQPISRECLSQEGV